MRHLRSVSTAILSLFACAAFALGAARPAAAADPDLVTVTTGRVSLEDVMPSCPPSACKLDLGPAPPPQVSWLVDAQVIRNALESAGEDGRGLREVRAVRVVSAARVLNPAEAGDFVRASVEAALPPGVTLTSVEAKVKLTLPLRGSAGATTFPKLPKRAGPITTTAMVDIQLDGMLVRRVSVLVRLTRSGLAARAAVPRGQTLTLVIERRTLTISTDGVALRDAEIGEVAPFKVQRTGRVLNALVKSQGLAQVLEAE